MKYNIKSVAYVLPILIFAPVYNIPRFFEFTSNPGDPDKNSTMFCEGKNETILIEDQFLIELVIKSNESILNNLKILCIQNNPVEFLVMTETRKDNLYILVTISFYYLVMPVTNLNFVGFYLEKRKLLKVFQLI